MKIKSWVQLVGILFIFMGGTGLIGNLSLLFSELPASHTREFTWHFIYAPKLGLLINLLFLSAGAIFLSGKRFSVPLIYVVLVLDIFFRIIPVLFFSVYHAAFFIMIRPVINLIILVIVFHVSAHLNEPEKKVEFFSRQLAYLSPDKLKLVAITGFLFLLIPLYIQLLWIYISSTVESYLARDTFYSNFPDFMNGSAVLNYLSIFCCLIAITAGLIGMKLSKDSWWKASAFTMALGSILMFLNIFQLM
jgi:hypothetical protein